MQRTLFRGAIASAVIASACATAAPPPTSTLVESRTAVRMAEEAGAANDAAGAHDLTLARQQIAEAERLIRGGRDWSAQRTLEMAQVYADLALEHARLASARADAETTRAEIARLQSGGEP